MTTYNFSKRASREYKIALDRWARRLEADEMTIHADGTVTLICKEGYICEHYQPSAKELRYKENTLSWQEQAAFFGEY